MPPLSSKTIRWQRFVPNLPGNRELKDPFHVKLHATLTKDEMRELERKLLAQPVVMREDGESDEAFGVRRDGLIIDAQAEALAPYVQLGSDTLVLDGERIETLRQYLAAMTKWSSHAYFLELSAALVRTNGISGVQDFFSESLSGGFATTG